MPLPPANKPDTKAVFQAAAIQEKIREHLHGIKNANPAEIAMRYAEIINTQIPALRTLNSEHFGSSKGINQMLEELAFFAKQKNIDQCWKKFTALADLPGDNFGTWAV